MNVFTVVQLGQLFTVGLSSSLVPKFQRSFCMSSNCTILPLRALRLKLAVSSSPFSYAQLGVNSFRIDREIRRSIDLGRDLGQAGLCGPC